MSFTHRPGEFGGEPEVPRTPERLSGEAIRAETALREFRDEISSAAADAKTLQVETKREEFLDGIRMFSVRADELERSLREAEEDIVSLGH